MNVAIDGLSTLLGQTIADVIRERGLTSRAIVSILHGQLEDLNQDDNDQLDVSSNSKIKNSFLQDINFSELDIVFIADNKKDNLTTFSQAAEAGVTIIDCAGISTVQEDIPLVVHDINSYVITSHDRNGQKTQGIKPGLVIAIPSPGATILSQVLFPLTQLQSIERVNVCHFSPAADLGKTGLEQLSGQTAQLLNGMPLKTAPSKTRQGVTQLAFNLVPFPGSDDGTNDTNDEGDYSAQEVRLASETRRLLNDDTIVINATCIQVPVFYAQSQVVDITFAQAIHSQAVESLFKRNKGFQVRHACNASPVAMTALGEHDDLIISRIRQNQDDERSLTLWCVSDNLRRGAAVNAVQIAEILIKSYL